MEEADVAHSIIIDVCGIYGEDYREGNDHAAEAVRGHPDKLIGFAYLHPPYAGIEACPAECRPLRPEAGVQGAAGPSHRSEGDPPRSPHRSPFRQDVLVRPQGGLGPLTGGHDDLFVLDVRDVARAFLHGLDNFDAMKGGPYNVGLSDANLSKYELCERRVRMRR